MLITEGGFSCSGTVPGTGTFSAGRSSFYWVDPLPDNYKTENGNVALSYPPGWEITASYCEHSGTGVCPPSSGATGTISGIKVDCGAEYEYGWILRKTSECGNGEVDPSEVCDTNKITDQESWWCNDCKFRCTDNIGHYEKCKDDCSGYYEHIHNICHTTCGADTICGQKNLAEGEACSWISDCDDQCQCSTAEASAISGTITVINPSNREIESITLESCLITQESYTCTMSGPPQTLPSDGGDYVFAVPKGRRYTIWLIVDSPHSFNISPSIQYPTAPASEVDFTITIPAVTPSPTPTPERCGSCYDYGSSAYCNASCDSERGGICDGPCCCPAPTATPTSTPECPGNCYDYTDPDLCPMLCSADYPGYSCDGPCCCPPGGTGLPTGSVTAAMVDGACNGDGVVNTRDFGAIVSNYGGVGVAGDVNSDGITNGLDLSFTLRFMGEAVK